MQLPSRLSDYNKVYTPHNNLIFDSNSREIRSIFEENISSSSSSLSSSSSSINYDLFFSGITLNDFPDFDLSAEELTFAMLNQKTVTGQTIKKVKEKIEALQSEGKIFGCLLKKIMTITHQIHQENSDKELKDLSLEAFENHLKEHNIYFCLNHAYKMNSEEQIKICLKYIEKQSFLKLGLFGANLTIEINILQGSFDQISIAILNLSKIFDSNVFVSLLPRYWDQPQVLEDFLKLHGTLLHSLSINQHIKEVSDNFLEKIIQYCPNLIHLSIKSNALKGTSLNKLNLLKELVSLDLSWCINITGTVSNLPYNLRKINFSNCSSIEKIEGKYPYLLEVDISFCIKLKHLPEKLSKGVKVSKFQCWNLFDTSIS